MLILRYIQLQIMHYINNNVPFVILDLEDSHVF